MGRELGTYRSHSMLVLHTGGRLASLRLEERRREDTEHRFETRKKNRAGFNVNEW